MTFDVARESADAAQANAQANGLASAICIVDDGGHLIYLERLDHVPSDMVDAAVLKAQTAASYHLPTKTIEDGIAQGHLEAVSKSRSRSLESIPADQTSSELQEGFMDFGKSLVADSKTMEIMNPGMSTFDYPSILPESAAMLSAALCENRFNAPFAQFLSVCFGVVSAVSIDDLGLSQRVAANATDDWNRVDQRQQLCDVVTIGTGQDNRERHPVCVSSDMVLRAGPRTIYGVRPVFGPPQ